jgi:Carboxypeptidase regulatory-like domain/Putative zinc-finger
MARIAHPDENLLAAFAERTLSSSERRGVMEHLSTCSDCRDAVFLAQRAAADARLEQETSESKIRLERPGARLWHWGAIVAGGLLSAMLIVTPVLIHRNARRAMETPQQQSAASRPNAAPIAGAALSSTRSEDMAVDALSTMNRKAHSAVEPRRNSQSRAAVTGAAPEASATPPSAGPVGKIVGSVIDPSGAAIPGARVSARRLSGEGARQAVTDQSGRFAVHGVAPGNYEVDFTAPGFETATKEISVPTGKQAELSTALKVGSASQSVEVSPAAVGGIGTANASTTVNVAAQPALPQTQNGRLAGVISSQKTSALPLSGRNLLQSASLASALPALAFSIKDGAVQSCAGNVCAPRPLPSPSAAVSVASDAQTAIAVDADGNVFVSADHGGHWTGIAVQWQGKAVAVQVNSALPAEASRIPNQTASAPSASSLGGPLPVQAPLAAPSVFELRTEQGQAWLSSDAGKTWRMK